MQLDHVNLLPAELRTGQGPDLQKLLISSWVISILLLTSMTFLKAREASAKDAEYQRLAEVARSMGASVQEITTRVKNTEDANKKVASAREFLENRATWTESLKELSLLIPNTVWLTSLQIKSNDERGTYLEMIGEAPSQTKIAGFLGALENSLNFHEVFLKKSEKLAEVTPDLYRFTFETVVPAAPKVTTTTMVPGAVKGTNGQGK
jgi:Tfp pilus assembly protein PilN